MTSRGVEWWSPFAFAFCVNDERAQAARRETWRSLPLCSCAQAALFFSPRSCEKVRGYKDETHRPASLRRAHVILPLSAVQRVAG